MTKFSSLQETNLYLFYNIILRIILSKLKKNFFSFQKCMFLPVHYIILLIYAGHILQKNRKYVASLSVYNDIDQLY